MAGQLQAHMKAKPKILFLVTEDWYFCLHWIALARAARDSGMEVLAATRVHNHGESIENEGITLFPIRLRRRSLSPLQEFQTLLELIRLYRRERPDVVHHIALKPIVYGSIAARLARVPATVNAFAGLGSTFIAHDWLTRILRTFLEQVLRWVLAMPASCVIVQNEDDRLSLVQAHIAPASRIVVIRGVGVETARFSPQPEPEGLPVVMLPSRMLWDKGIGEFVEAIRLLKSRGLNLRGVLAGMVDTENPAHIPEAQLLAWQSQGLVEWWGHQDSMPQVIASAHVIVLPSYREGLPQVLVEAASCARPIIATDVPGCREVVRDGINGLLVPAQDAHALAHAIARLVRDSNLRTQMGQCGREIAEREFSVGKVVAANLAVYRELLEQAGYSPPVLDVAS